MIYACFLAVGFVIGLTYMNMALTEVVCNIGL